MKRRQHLRRADSSRLFRHLTAGEIDHLLPESRPAETVNLHPQAASALRAPTGETTPIDLKALFLGPQAANAEWVEQMLLRVFRDHVFWRLNFHPEDLPAIRPEEQTQAGYQAVLARLQRELFLLLGELKSDIPFYSPRYLGHMLADLSLPALLGYFATLLYNPNNCSWEASPVTTLLEVEVGRELASMLGFGRTPEQLADTWGHITSGGSIANIEVMWVAKALKFLPIAVRFAAAELELNDLMVGQPPRPLAGMSAWELVNLTPSAALDLKDRLLHAYVQAHPDCPPQDAMSIAMEGLKAHEILTLGDHAFFARLQANDALNAPVIYAPQTMHYCLVKGAGAVGVGGGQVIPIPTDSSYRLDVAWLEQAFIQAARDRRPIIMVIGIAGSTEEGAVDPLDGLVALRDERAAQEQGFFLHCDAAYGGYLAACFRDPSGELRSLSTMQAEYAGWPSPEVYASYVALGQVDAAVVDPHKLGYVPYPAGAVVFRDGRCKELIAQEAAYALGGRATHAGEFNLGRYILEGSKPGAAAAAIFLAHRVVPLDCHGYGQLLGQAVRIARGFYQRLQAFAATLQSEFIVRPLVLPDTNIVDYCFNPVGNDRLDVMNRFAQALYRRLSIDPQNPIQTRRFIVSHTEFSYAQYTPAVLRFFLEEHLGIQGRYLVATADLRQRRQAGQAGYDDTIMVFRTTLMNPFLLEKVHGDQDYLELFLEELPSLLRQAWGAVKAE